KCICESKILFETCNKTQIGIMIRGGIGDVMIAARWLYNFINHVKGDGEFLIDIYYSNPENIVFIFGNFNCIRYIYNDITFEHVCGHYDVALVINHLGFLESKK